MARTSSGFHWIALGAGCLWMTLAGCGRSESETAVAAGVPSSAKKSRAPSAKFAPVNEAIKSGAFDDAAAQLLAMQTSGQNFTAREAADYRNAMNDAYTRALTAAKKGDQRAVAALQMLRATKPR